MIDIQKWIKSLPENTVRMTGQVHDELLFEVKTEFLDEALNKIKDTYGKCCNSKSSFNCWARKG